MLQVAPVQIEIFYIVFNKHTFFSKPRYTLSCAFPLIATRSSSHISCMIFWFIFPSSVFVVLISPNDELFGKFSLWSFPDRKASFFPTYLLNSVTYIQLGRDGCFFFFCFCLLIYLFDMLIQCFLKKCGDLFTYFFFPLHLRTHHIDVSGFIAFNWNFRVFPYIFHLICHAFLKLHLIHYNKHIFLKTSQLNFHREVFFCFLNLILAAYIFMQEK